MKMVEYAEISISAGKRMMLVNVNKRLNVIQDPNFFFKVMKKLELYLVKFNKTSLMFPKIYFPFFGVDRDKYQPLIVN